MALQLNKIAQIHVRVEDVDRAVNFYEHVLGMKFVARFQGMAFFDCQGVRLYLAPAEQDRFQQTSLIYYSVPDMAEAVKALEENKVAIKQGPLVVHREGDTQMWVALFDDSEGNSVAITSQENV